MHGLVDAAGVRLAVPLESLREVVPWPAELVRLPVTAPGLVGAVEVRGRVIPVVDLGALLGTAPDGDQPRIVAILSLGGDLLGLAADGVRGVAAVDDADLQPLDGDGDRLVRSTFRHEDVVASVLDVPAVMALPAVPRAREAVAAVRTDDPDGTATAPDRPAPDEDAANARRDVRPVMRFRCGDHQLCLPAVEVHTVLPALRPQPSALDGSLCRGVTTHRGREMAVVPLAALLALDPAAPAEGRPGVALRLAEGVVVLAVDEVIDIEPRDLSGVLPAPPGTLRRHDLYAGLLADETFGQVLVLDAAALRAEPDLQGMAALNLDHGDESDAEGADRPDGAPAAADGAPRRGDVRPDDRTYLTYRVGPPGRTADVATLLDQVGEIVAFPAGRAVTGTDRPDLVGVFVHRGRPVPLVCLSAATGRGAVDPVAAQLLLVEVDDRPVAFVVSGLHAIERASWSEQLGDDAPDPADLRHAPLVRTSAGSGEERLAPVLDLHALARAVLGPVPAPEAGAVPRQGGVPVGV